MRHTMNLTKTALFGITLLGALLVTGGVAAASPAEDYRDAMAGLEADLQSWVADLDTATDAAVAKPQLACDESYAALILIGNAMHDDLRGTGRLAPAAIGGAHDALTGHVAGMVEAAEGACGDSLAAAERLDHELAGYVDAHAKIQTFSNAAFRVMGPPTTSPDLPVSGN